MNKALLSIALVAATACSSPPTTPTEPNEASTPVSTPESKPVTPPKPVVEFSRWRLEAPGGASAERWTAGSECVLSVTVNNHGKALMDYPSLVLTSGEARVEVVEGEKVLYGLVRDHPTPYRWTLKSDAALAKGSAVKLTLRAYEHNSDHRAGRAPISEATYELHEGDALSP